MVNEREFSFRQKPMILGFEKSLGDYAKTQTSYDGLWGYQNLQTGVGKQFPSEQNENNDVQSVDGLTKHAGTRRSSDKKKHIMKSQSNSGSSLGSGSPSKDWLAGLDAKAGVFSQNSRTDNTYRNSPVRSNITNHTNRRAKPYSGKYNNSRKKISGKHRRLRKLPCFILLVLVVILILGGCKIFQIKEAANVAENNFTFNFATYAQQYWHDNFYVGKDIINDTDKTIVMPRSEYEAYCKQYGGEENLEKYTYFREVANGTLKPSYLSRGSVFSAKTGKKMIALSFDDGPNADTIDDYLAALKKYNAHATFFMLGQSMEKDPDSVQKIIDSGNEPATHSWNHKNFNKFSASAIQTDLEQAVGVFQKIVGYKPYLMRCPYGNINENVKKIDAQMQMISIMWDIDTQDWKTDVAANIINNIKAHAGDGQIILMHEGKSVDLQALPAVLQWLTSEGYTVVSVGDLLWQAHENGTDGLSDSQDSAADTGN